MVAEGGLAADEGGGGAGAGEAGAGGETERFAEQKPAGAGAESPDEGRRGGPEFAGAVDAEGEDGGG